MPRCATDIEHASFENAKGTPMVSDEEVIQIVQSYPAERRYALAAMQDMQHAFNYIPEKGLHCLAKHLNCGVAQLYSMATFYKALSLKPKGKHIIKICNGTACHIRGSVNLATGLKRESLVSAGRLVFLQAQGVDDAHILQHHLVLKAVEGVVRLMLVANALLRRDIRASSPGRPRVRR